MSVLLFYVWIAASMVLSVSCIALSVSIIRRNRGVR